MAEDFTFWQLKRHGISYMEELSLNRNSKNHALFNRENGLNRTSQGKNIRQEEPDGFITKSQCSLLQDDHFK